MDRKDLHGFCEDLNAFSVQEFRDIKRRPDILEKLRFDVTPRMIMEPRLGEKDKREIAGYSFYIEAFDDPPVLMLMKVGKTGITSTVGKVDEIPPEMVRRAIDHPVEPKINRMYAISDEIGEWLREELSL